MIDGAVVNGGAPGSDPRDRDWVEVTTLPDLLVRAAALAPQSTALVFPERRVTYAALLDGALQVAAGLAGLGVERGQHVGILMPNCVEYLEGLFGVAMLGAVVVPVNARYKPAELAHVIADAELRAVLVSDVAADAVDHVGVLRQSLAELASQRSSSSACRMISLGRSAPHGVMAREALREAGAGVDGAAQRRARQRIRLFDTALMMYTSGTTAEPKGAPLSHEALVRTSVQAGRTRFRFSADDRLFDPLPMFHMSFVLPMIGVFDATATVVTMTHFEPAAALALITGEQVTVDFSTFPTITQALLNHPDYTPESFRSVRLVNNVAPPDVLRALQAARPGARQITAYGLTEAGGVIGFGDPDDDEETRAHFARPFNGIELQVRDLASGEVLAPGEEGAIWVRGYNVFSGYHNDPVKTKECFDDEGWFFTGDIGRLDIEGRVEYLGRTKDMLKVGGENVAAAEVEACLSMHPAVSIAQVVSVPDDRLGEVPAAFVELRPGASAGPDELIAHCRSRIASFKVPRHVRFVTEWPMSATKIQKFRLREQLLSDLAASR